jgi:SAM-dependent methyltransferase
MKNIVHALADRVLGVPQLFKLFLRFFGAQSLFGDIIGREAVSRRPGRVVDLGCGVGVHAPLFAGWEYVGVDLNLAYVQAADRSNGQAYAVMDAAFIGLQSTSFDLAMVVGLIHHLDDSTAVKVLHEIRRVLRANGQVLLIEPIWPTSQKNWAGRILRQLDRGGFVRSFDEWAVLCSSIMTVVKSYAVGQGIWEFSVFVLGAAPAREGDE